MTKPVIVRRDTKGSPLTILEHDNNFTNLQNATIGLQAGSGGTTVTADLNGVITLVAGGGVTLSGNNTAKTITITTSEVAPNLGTNDLAVGASDNLTLNLRPPTGYALKPLQLSFNGITIDNPGGANVIQGADNSLTLATGLPANSNRPRIVMDGGIDSMIIGATGTISIGGGADLALGSGQSDVISLAGRLVLDTYTTTERNAISTPVNGTVLYNETVHKFQGRVNGAWQSLVSSTDEGVVDYSRASATYANNATVDFANFSGMIIVNNTGTTGNVALWLLGGGTAVKVSDTVGNSSGTITSVAGINGYRWTNTTGASDTFSFAAIKTRNTG